MRVVRLVLSIVLKQDDEKRRRHKIHLRGHYRLTPALDGPALKQRASVLPASRHGRGRRLSAKVHVAKVVSHAAGIVSTVDAVAEAELAVLVVAETLIR